MWESEAASETAQWPEFLGAKELAQRQELGMMFEHETFRNDDCTALRRSGKRTDFQFAACQGLLNKCVLPGMERRYRLLKMQGIRAGEYYRLDSGIPEHLARGVEGMSVILPRDRLSCCSISRKHADDLRGRRFAQSGKEVPPRMIAN